MLQFICSGCGMEIHFPQDRHKKYCEHCSALNITLQTWDSHKQAWHTTGEPCPPDAQLAILRILCEDLQTDCEMLHHKYLVAWRAIDAAKEKFSAATTACDNADLLHAAAKQLTSELHTHVRVTT